MTGTLRSPLRFEIFTIFPAMFAGPMDESIVQRARTQAALSLTVHDIRNWTHDRHQSTDDTPYGGGSGMVMSAPPIVTAVEAVLGHDLASARVLVMSPAGRLFSQRMAHSLAAERQIAIVCGRYEGVDDRVRTILGAEEVSIGDYVLTGGELPAMVIIDAVARLLPGVITDQSVDDESHSRGLVEYPHFTRPAEYRGHAVPPVLLSGHHANITAWREAEALRRTEERRPELLTGFDRQPVSGADLASDTVGGATTTSGAPRDEDLEDRR